MYESDKTSGMVPFLLVHVTRKKSTRPSGRVHENSKEVFVEPTSAMLATGSATINSKVLFVNTCSKIKCIS